MMNQTALDTLVYELRTLKKSREDLDNQISQIETALKDEMNARNEYELNGDDWKVTWNMVTSSRFNQTLFKEAHPQLFESYKTASSSRRFTLS